MTEPVHIINAVRSRGSDARDLRDAAHEACHAVELNVAVGSWDRDTIHDAIMATIGKRGGDTMMRSLQIARVIRFETTARAVERLTCQRFDIDIGDWADIAFMEAMQGAGIRLPSVDWIREQIDREVTTPQVKKLVAKIFALPDEVIVKPSRRKKRT